MFLTPDELSAVLYDYQLNQIVEQRTDIIDEAIAAAISELRSYLAAANAQRLNPALNAQEHAAYKIYDLQAIFSAQGSDRHPLLLRLCKRIAAYNVCELAAPDIIYEHVHQRYADAIATLEKIAGMGAHLHSRLVLHDLPSPAGEGGTGGGEPSSTANAQPFRMVSRTKFNHE